jgi:hypothetical protein
LATDAKVRTLDDFPVNVRNHLVERMLDRSISLEDLNKLRQWIETQPDGPEADWFKDFGSFELCGKGALPKTFLLAGQAAKGKSL